MKKTIFPLLFAILTGCSHICGCGPVSKGNLVDIDKHTVDADQYTVDIDKHTADVDLHTVTIVKEESLSG